jgi:hypothetical protein
MDQNIISRFVEFIGIVARGWLFWIGLLLMVEPYLEGVAPRFYNRLNQLLGDRRRSIFVAVGILALVISFFQAWDAQKTETKAAENTAKEFQTKLDEREHKRQIREELGKLLKDGTQLEGQSYDISNDISDFTNRVNEWLKRCEEFFAANMDDSFIPRFRDYSGLTIPTNNLAYKSQERANIWGQIFIRNARLQEFIKEYQN